MKVLVIGQGGREHAIVRALKFSNSVSEVHALPGSAGIALDAICHPGESEDSAAIYRVVEKSQIDLVIVGPEQPLINGVTDRLRRLGVPVVGPSQTAAQLEGSKIFCKEFLQESKVPTARAFVVASVPQTMAAAENFAPPYVLKADGLAAGKGVFICKNLAELEGAAQDLFVARSLGEAGARALLEEFQPGYEISYLLLTNGESFEPLPIAQDHKRLSDGDHGPNTGGMGAVAPIAIDSELRKRIDVEILQPTLAGFRRRGFFYRGVLFIGIMVTRDGPQVLEFNTRFGDPETQAILPLFAGDWGVAFRDLAIGKLQPMSWKSLSSCCVVLAAEGYPDHPVKGAAILTRREMSSMGAAAEGLTASSTDHYVLHAGSRLIDEKWVTAGGRVLNAVGVAETIPDAIKNAYTIAADVSWTGMQMRTDIGARQL